MTEWIGLNKPTCIKIYFLYKWQLHRQDMTVTGCCYRKSPKRRHFFPSFGSHFENDRTFEDAYLLL